MDGDGALSQSEKEEVKAFHQAKLEEKVAEFEAQFDLDENGELDADEESQLQAYVQEKISSGLPMIGPNSNEDVDQDE